MASEEEPTSGGNLKLSEQDFNLISQANDEFNRSEYDKCLQTLDELETSMGSNTKIRHNRAIVEFYKTEGKEYDDLLLNLENLTVSNELVKADAGHSKNASLSPIAVYNKAVVYYYKGKLYKAIDALTPLVDRLEDFDESTAMTVGTLMLNLLLETNQPSRAQKFLETMESKIGFNFETLEGNPSQNRVINQNGSRVIYILTHILNKKPITIPDDGTLDVSALKAHQYYIMKDFQMAAKQLMKISENSGKLEFRKDLKTYIANNMGIIHLRVRHYAIAAKFFQNAVNFDGEIVKSLPKVPLQELGLVHTREILYNLGIAMLHLRRPDEAFRCFLVPLKTYHSNPRLWFRLAETCIMHHEMKVIDAGKSKKYFSQSQSMENKVEPEPSLEFAVICLRSALTLVSFYKTQLSSKCSSPDVDKETQTAEIDINICNPSTTISEDSLDKMLSGIYAAYSYVSLRIGDYLMAHELAQELLKMENLSDAYKMLAHMYAGEALIKMNKLADARTHLDPQFVSTLNGYDFETKNWKVKSLDAAQAIVRYNFVVAMVLQGDFELARNMLCSCTHPIVASNVLNLKRYLDINSTKTSVRY